MRASDGLSQRRANIDSLQLRALILLALHGYRIRRHDSRQLALIDRLDGIAGQDAVGDQGNDLLRAVRHDRLGGLGQRTARVGHVVDEDGSLAGHVAHEDHATDLVRSRSLLVNEREPQIQSVSNRRGSLRAARVGTHDDAVLDVEVLPDPAQGAGLGVQVVDGDVEEALDLRGVQVHGDDVVAAGGLQHVRDELGGDGGARLVLLVLARVGEVGDHGGDAARGGGLARVDHDEELHEAVVDFARGGGLEDED